VGDSEVVLSTSDVAFIDHESRLSELESDLASSMRREFRLRQRLSVLEGALVSVAPRSSDSDAPRLHRRHIAGERGTPYPCLSQRLQMVRRTSGPPREANCESWVGEGSEASPLRLIPIEDVSVKPPLTVSSSEDKEEYQLAPVVKEEDERVGITDVSEGELDLAGSKRISSQD
jgi:hypothetical protein